jgi:EAL domain-containing protein (putative c-di-GMP-specific phosphodiesterase class I)/GGDEF domain-containing protein
MLYDAGASQEHRFNLLNLLKAPDESRDEILTQFVRLTAQKLGIPGSFVSVVDDEQQTVMASLNFSLKVSTRENAFCRHVVDSDEPMVVQDTLLDPRFISHPLTTGAPYIRFYAGVPLRDIDGFVPGTLCVTDTRPHAFSAGQIHSLTLLSTMVMSFLRAWYSAGLTDAVTGLPDRQQLVRDLQAAAADERKPTRRLMLIDCLDMSRARELVRSLGAPAVEGLLQDIATLIPLRLRPGPGEKLYSFSAGRFALLAQDEGRLSAGRISTLLHGISAHLGDNISLELSPVTGETHFNPGAGSAREVVAQALSALTDATIRGIPAARFDLPLAEDLPRFVSESDELIAVMRSGRGLTLLYQPRLCMEKGLPVGLEAHVEWDNPRFGCLGPGKLGEIGISSAALSQLTDWTLNQVITQLKQWHNTCITLPVSVFVSDEDIARSGFAKDLKRRMKKARLSPALLQIECLTPDAIPGSPAALEGISRLRQYGFVTTLDDLSMTSGNQTYLLRPPPAVVSLTHELKASLSADAASRIMVRGIIRMLESQDYRVITSLDEDTDGSDAVNGFFYARSLPAAAVQSWLYWKLRDNCNQCR